MNSKIVLIGAGGHGKVVLDTIRAAGLEIWGVVDPALAGKVSLWRGLPVLGDDNDLLQINHEDVVLANGVGSLPGQEHRRYIFEKFTSIGFSFHSVTHPSAIVASGVRLHEGSQLMAGSIVQVDSTIGRNTIVNTGARIDHDCDIGPNVHIAPGVVISGGVSICEGVHIGTGASVIQGVTVGKGAVIGAGTVVIRDVPANARVVGTPPRVTSGQGLE